MICEMLAFTQSDGGQRPAQKWYETVIRLLERNTEVYTLPSVLRKINSLDENWFKT